MHKEDGSTRSGPWFRARAKGKHRDLCSQQQNHYKLDTKDLCTCTNSYFDARLALQCCHLRFPHSHTAQLLTVRDKLGLTLDSANVTYLKKLEEQAQKQLSPSMSSINQLLE